MSEHTTPAKLSPMASVIFFSRWLQLPLYLGLILAQCVYVYHFWVELSVLIGAVFVTVGVLILTGNPLALRSKAAAPAVVYGLLCGLSIAAYTLWDKQAVSVLLIPPVIFTWAGNAAQAFLLAPNAYRYRDQVRHAWAIHRREIFGIGILDSLSYILFLIALSVGTVSNLAPVRQTSILIGAFMGTRLLSEEASRRRLIAAAVMLAGLVALAFG